VAVPVTVGISDPRVDDARHVQFGGRVGQVAQLTLFGLEAALVERRQGGEQLVGSLQVAPDRTLVVEVVLDDLDPAVAELCGRGRCTVV
jgi:hypothetical protein